MPKCRPERRPGRAAGLALALAAGIVAAADETGNPPMLAADAPVLAVCARCHGPGGNTTTPGMPSLGGQNAHYLLEELEEYRSRARPTDVPEHYGAAIAAVELVPLANYFAAQPYQRSPQPVDAGKATRGAEAYQRICQLCHPDNGRATTYSEYPLLAGQDLDYMLKTMADILSGKRPANGFMREMVALAPAERLDEAIHFFAAQEAWPEEVTSTRIGSPAAKRRRFNPGRQ